MEDRIVKFYGQIEESRLDQLKTSLNNLGVQFSVQKQLTFEDLGLAQVETTNAIPPPQQQQQTQQKVQIVRSNDCKSQVRGILPGQQLVQMPDGKLQIFSQPRTVQPKQQLEPVQQQQQKVQIVRSNDGKIRARGLLPGQLLVQMPDGKLQIFSQQQHPHVQQQLQSELNCQCPRCEIIIPRSKLNQHMNQAHGIKVFNQLTKRTFNTSNFPVKIIKPFLDSDPLALSQEEFNNNAIKTEQCINNDVNDSKVKVKSAKKANKRKIETSSDSEDYEEKDLVEDKSDALMKMKNIKPFLNSNPLTLSHKEFNNNDMKTEQSFQESEEKIKSEKFDSDLEIKNDVNDFKTELADEESEEIPIFKSE